MSSILQRLALTSTMILAVSVLSATSQAADYKVDPMHSTVGFSVRHMMISNVTGQFNDVSGDFTFDPEAGTLGNNKFEVKTASIDTHNAKRDEHLRSPDFFDVAKYPTLSITNSKIKKTGNHKYEWTGELNMHGVSKPVKFDLEYGGSIKDMMGDQRAAFTAHGKIKRSEWGLKWNKALESGGVVVGDDVTIDMSIEAVEAKKK